MHTLVRRYIKTAIVFLAVGLAIGTWMIVRRELFGRFPTSYEISAHTHAVFVGFVMELILGVALWLFPRPAKDDTRYRPELIAAAYWLLTAATAARIAGELARAVVSSLPLRWLVVVSGAGQALAILLFFSTMWSRIRPLGSKSREEAGERF
jgi:heme/copper-type cytochrome/quinol oxidase subunit 1